VKNLVFLLALVLYACTTPQQKAPVIERAPGVDRPSPPKPAKKTTAEKDWRPDSYTVKKGDTLYALGLEFGFDYKEIARWNDIPAPYVIKVGQKLKLKESATTASQPTATKPTEVGVVATPIKLDDSPKAKPIGESAQTETTSAPAGTPPTLSEPKATKTPYSEQVAPPEEKKAEPAKPVEKPAEKAVVEEDAVDWSWPTPGKVLNNFTEASKGIDIAGEMGQPVLAAAPGKVVYSGSSLRGYGKLVIIKHNKTYLSAYAHNSQILVKEGQEVSKGQKIAEIGNTDADRVKLHFEIRKQGKPVDPSKLLPAN
jgi:lipoprotein NlpD